MKLKTRKSVSKKFKITGSGKLLRRATGQNHYNTRDTGVQTRRKRRDKNVFKTDSDNLKRALPYA